MPPLRSGLRVGNRSRDVVSQVEDKLKTNLPRGILEATRSSLRVLNIRNRIGCFGKYDNETKRACALLEYEVRHYNSNNRIRIDIPMERFAKAAFMKSKDYRSFYDKIGNFRDDLNVDSSIMLMSKRRRHNDEKHDGIESRAVFTETSKSNIWLNKSSISLLAIQFGAFVQDPSDVALRTLEFFQEIIDLLEKSSENGRIFGLLDVKRNLSSYEAACFYLVATSKRRRPEKESIRRRPKFTKEYNDGDENQELDLMTFMDITKVSSKFQMILDYVGELRDEIELKRCLNHNVSAESTSRGTSFSLLNDSKNRKCGGSRKKIKKEFSDKNDIENLDDQKVGQNAGVCISSILHNNLYSKEFSFHQNRNNVDFQLNTNFDVWKSNILQEACEKGTKTLNARKVGELHDCKTKERLVELDDVLDFVTRGILLRNGFL